MPGNPAQGRPIPVEVKPPEPGALEMLLLLIQPLINPLTTAAIVFVFLIFILIQREDLRHEAGK